VQQGDLSIAISTGGKSPALAKKLRKELEMSYGPEYEGLLHVLGKLREKMVVRGRSSDENRQLFDAVIDSDILQHIKDKNWEQVKKIIYEITGVEIEVDE
jgi:precorrin-2 dehydrogenase/sirohydrochlorin ferrochelatase